MVPVECILQALVWWSSEVCVCCCVDIRSRPPAPVDTRTKEEIAAELARVAEAARLAAIQQQQNNPQALQLSRHARRVYVGGLPAGISEVTLINFFNQVSDEAGHDDGTLQHESPST